MGDFKMKKIFGLLLSLILIISVCGCKEATAHTRGGKSSDYTVKKEFSPGELIVICDNETEAQIGTFIITNISILSENPYTKYDYLCTKEEYENGRYSYYDEDEITIIGNSVYAFEEYSTIVQIDYLSTASDSDRLIDGSNLNISDCKKERADYSVKADYELIPTKYKSIVVGLKNKGDIKITIQLDSFEESICRIICKYDEKTNSYIIDGEDLEEMLCPSCKNQFDYSDSYCGNCGKKLK